MKKLPKAKASSTELPSIASKALTADKSFATLSLAIGEQGIYNFSHEYE